MPPAEFNCKFALKRIPEFSGDRTQFIRFTNYCDLVQKELCPDNEKRGFSSSYKK